MRRWNWMKRMKYRFANVNRRTRSSKKSASHFSAESVQSDRILAEVAVEILIADRVHLFGTIGARGVGDTGHAIQFEEMELFDRVFDLVPLAAGGPYLIAPRTRHDEAGCRGIAAAKQLLRRAWLDLGSVYFELHGAVVGRIDAHLSTTPGIGGVTSDVKLHRPAVKRLVDQLAIYLTRRRVSNKPPQPAADDRIASELRPFVFGRKCVPIAVDRDNQIVAIDSITQAIRSKGS